ncbi:hypothetical protein, partial [Saccharicrinis sp. GN24d3]|uniref:hypothetical protein n=1 Tax=Saccharicrinis sp. GN24d3 TaxID=3458416 RepID=UPI004036F72D
QRLLDEACGDLTSQTFQTTPEPNLLFVFIFSLLKPNQRFGGVQTPYSTSKTLLNPHALFQIVRAYYFLSIRFC